MTLEMLVLTGTIIIIAHAIRGYNLLKYMTPSVVIQSFCTVIIFNLQLIQTLLFTQANLTVWLAQIAVGLITSLLDADLT